MVKDGKEEDQDSEEGFPAAFTPGEEEPWEQEIGEDKEQAAIFAGLREELRRSKELFEGIRWQPFHIYNPVKSHNA